MRACTAEVQSFTLRTGLIALIEELRRDLPNRLFSQK